ncbi:MAG: hypothetical protein AAF840_17905, partial [Bacteroidota bacterium]
TDSSNTSLTQNGSRNVNQSLPAEGGPLSLTGEEKITSSQASTGNLAEQNIFFKESAEDVSDDKMSTADIAQLERTIYAIDPVASLDFTPLVHARVRLQQQMQSPPPSEIVRRLSSPWSIGLAGGGTHWRPGFEVTGAPDGLEVSETGLLSFGLEAGLHYQLNDKWRLSTGVQYLEHVSRFDYTYARDTSATEMVTFRLINAISGEEMGLDSTEVTATGTITRQLVDYNTYRQWVLPVMVARQWTLHDRLGLSLGLGVQYTLSATVTGRTLQADASMVDAFQPITLGAEQVNYAGTLAIMGDLGLEYQLSDKLGLSLATQFSRATQNTQAQLGLRSVPGMTFTRLGLRYNF